MLHVNMFIAVVIQELNALSCFYIQCCWFMKVTKYVKKYWQYQSAQQAVTDRQRAHAET